MGPVSFLCWKRVRRVRKSKTINCKIESRFNVENDKLPKCIKMLKGDWFTYIIIYYFSLLEGMNIFLFKQIQFTMQNLLTFD